MTIEQADSLIGIMEAAVGRNMRDDQRAAYEQHLKRIPYEAGRSGVRAAIDNWTRAGYPPIGVIRKHADEAQIQHAPDPGKYGTGPVRPALHNRPDIIEALDHHDRIMKLTDEEYWGALMRYKAHQETRALVGV